MKLDEVFADDVPIERSYTRSSADLYDNIKAVFQFGGIWKVVSWMSSSGYDFDDVPQAREMFEERKDRIIKELLQNIREGDMGYANRRIGSLFDIGVDWQELRMILKSIIAAKAEREARRNVAEESDPLASIKHDIYQTLQKAAKEKGIWYALRRIAEWDVADKIPELLELIDEYKTVIVTKLLTSVKENVKHNDFSYVNDWVNILKGFGVKWPELDIILNSISSIETEKEPVAEDENEWYDDYNEYEYGIKDIVDAINDNDLALAHDAWLGVTNKDSITNILDVLINNVTSERLQTFLEQHKKEIVKDLLWDLKDGITDDAENKLISLATVDIEWPELAIIKKSLHADKQITEDEPGSQEDFIKASIPRLFQQNNPGAALNIINAHYKMNPRNLEWLRKNITPILQKPHNKKKLINWVVNSVNAVVMGRITSANKLLQELGVDLPDIKTIIEANKEHIIKRYLQVIQNHGTADVVTQDINNLRKLGITWPELDIIERSSKANVNEDSDSRRQYEIDHILDEIDIQLGNGDSAFITWMYRLKHYDALPQVKPILEKYKEKVIAYAVKTAREGKILDIVRFKDLLKEAGVEFPELDTIIEDNKDYIVKMILSKVKLGHKDTPDRIIQQLYKAEINWPELAVIKRSLEAEKKRLGPPDHEN